MKQKWPAKLFLFLLILFGVSVILLHNPRTHIPIYYAAQDLRIENLCQEDVQPSAYSQSLESAILGNWVYVPQMSDSSQLISWHHFHFQENGKVQFSFKIKDTNAKIQQKGEYQFCHRGSARRYPGRSPHIMITVNSLIDRKNKLPLFDVRIGLDSRFPVSKDILSFQDSDGKQHFFIQEQKNSLNSILLETIQTNLVPDKGSVYHIVMTFQLHETHQPGPKEADTFIAWRLANEFVFRTSLRDRYILPSENAGPLKNEGEFEVVFKEKNQRRPLTVRVNILKNEVSIVQHGF